MQNSPYIATKGWEDLLYLLGGNCFISLSANPLQRRELQAGAAFGTVERSQTSPRFLGPLPLGTGAARRQQQRGDERRRQLWLERAGGRNRSERHSSGHKYLLISAAGAMMVWGHKQGRIWKQTSCLLLVLTNITGGKKKIKTRFHDLKMSRYIWKLSIFFSGISVANKRHCLSPQLVVRMCFQIRIFSYSISNPAFQKADGKIKIKKPPITSQRDM